MNYNVRIDENFLKAEHQDGEVLHHTDLNELESVVKTAVNANYEDIQKIQDGTLPVSGAYGLEGDEGRAILSQYATEVLQASDGKIPSSMQVKAYVDNAINAVNTGLVYFWDGTPGAESAAIFNQICHKYDTGGKFVFYGLVNVNASYTDPVTGETVQRERNLIAPISVSKLDDISQGYTDMSSFTVPPLYLGFKYAVSGINLVGNWGNYTNVYSVTYSDSEAPVKMSQVEEIAAGIINTTYPSNITWTEDASFHWNETDAKILFNALFGVNTGRPISLKLKINNNDINFIGLVTRAEFNEDVDEFYGSVEAISIGIGKTYKIKADIHFEETDPIMHTWTKVLNDTLIYIYEV